METIVLSSPDQVHGYVAQALGFHPVDSVVVLGVNGGPLARVDPDPIEELVMALAPVIRHWSRVIVIGYGTGQPIAAELSAVFKGIGLDVDATFLAPNGRTVGARTDSVMDAGRVLGSREEMTAEARLVNEPAEAEALAWEAWRAGRGAQAWAFHDRAVELAGPTESMTELAAQIVGGADPRSAQ